MKNLICIGSFLNLAKELNKNILAIYNSTFEIDYKSDNSPLTKADKVSNELICSFLKKNYPNIPIISEENEQIPYENRKSYEYFWLIDPLDGTKEFVNKNDEFCVCIALIKYNRPIFGLILIPVKNEIFYALEDEGAYMLKDNKTTKLPLAKHNEVILLSRSHLSSQTKQFVAKNFPNHKTKQVGSAIKFCLIAKGEASITLRLEPTMEWDTAAGDIIIQETNKKTLNLETNKKMLYNKKSLKNSGFLVL